MRYDTRQTGERPVMKWLEGFVWFVSCRLAKSWRAIVAVVVVAAAAVGALIGPTRWEAGPYQRFHRRRADFGRMGGKNVLLFGATLGRVPTHIYGAG